jgi:DnaK suppressor protein
LSNSDLDQDFLDNQRRRLVDLKGELERMRDGLEEDQRQLEDQEDDLSEHDSGDMSHSIFDRELDATVEQTAEKRLHYVERALQKIEEGTYGVCDDTGENIPKGRLEAVPEAIRTVEAQRRFEQERHPPV